ncbi:beta-keratin-related protein-like [Myiozetetes cayanensis]|uniref:beta-keratin-related protein-like n=1 Tax=Myiozetetes cayanensis TaxID=478635 RepID=UPI00215F6AE3|nr:beta-keratin-related protein-like [Myiozetetes cayanensis]
MGDHHGLSQVWLCPMSPFHECCLPGLMCPEPFAVTSNETCVIKYPDTVVDIVEPDHPPYSLIYPGPTLTTFPQRTIVGSTGLLDLRSFLGSRGSLGFRELAGQPKSSMDICG